MTPHTIITVGRYNAGFPILFKKRFDGTCMSKYPTNRILRHVKYWVPVRCKSFCKPANRAAAILFRSR